MGVLSEAIHSGLDLISSLVTFFVVRASSRPADWDHPYGHGKMESLSAMLEAFLLLLAGGYIVYEGLSRLANPDHEIRNIHWGLWVTGFSVVVNLFVYRQNRDVAVDEESIAIETNSFHFLTDVFSSLAVFLSLGAYSLTKWIWIDPVVALLIAAYVFWVGIEQLKKCIAELSDTALPNEEVSAVRKTIGKFQNQYLSYHDLRTRKVGPVRHVEFHLEVCSDQKVHEAHTVCDRIEDALTKEYKEVDINIHVEPCGNHGPECQEICRYWKKPRSRNE